MTVELSNSEKENSNVQDVGDLLRQMSNILHKKRSDFVYLLNESGIPASESMSDDSLIELFVEKVSENKTLAVGSAILIHANSAESNFSSNEDSKKNVESIYKSLNGAFSNASGDVSAVIQSVASLGKELGGKALDQRNKKLYSTTDLLQKKQDAKIQMQATNAELKRDELKAQVQKKKNETIVIVSVVAGIATVSAILIYAYKNKNGK